MEEVVPAVNVLDCYIFCAIISWEMVFFAHGLIEYELFLNRSFWPIDENLIDAHFPEQSGPGSNGNEVYSTLPRSSELETHYLIL